MGFVSLHEGSVADDVGEEDCGEFSIFCLDILAFDLIRDVIK